MKISTRSLVTACLFVGISLQPVAVLAEDAPAPAQKPAAAAPAEKGGCPMANCPECANGGCCAACQAQAGSAAAKDCPCMHGKKAKARKGAAKAKRKAQAQANPQQ